MSKFVALLIDADNVPVVFCSKVFTASEQLGQIIVKRAFGDFTQGNAKSWSAILMKHGILPCLNLPTGSGKNAADISLTLNAMDLLHSNQIDVFCLVSSDSDFTPLATRIREQGKYVYGYGEDKTPGSFRAACHGFTILKKPTAGKTATNQANIKSPVNLSGFDSILSALAELEGQREWVTLSPLGKALKKRFPELRYTEMGGKTLKQVVVKMAGLKLLSTTKTNKGFSVRIP